MREALTTTVCEEGGRLVCLRKAKQFTDWAARTERPAYGLIVGWREAKPCLRSLAWALPQCAWPQVVIVVCEEERQAKRAKSFQEDVGLPDLPVPVLVRQGLDHPEALAQEVRELVAAGGFDDDASPRYSATESATEEDEEDLQEKSEPGMPQAALMPFLLASLAGTQPMISQEARRSLMQALQAAAPAYYED